MKAYSSLDGELELRDDGPDGAVLALNASYRVPPASRRPAAIMTATQSLGRQVVRAIATEFSVANHMALSPAQLQVRNLMTAAPIVLHTDQSLLSATLVLLHHHIAGAPVTDESGRLVGVLSESDMLVREASPRPGSGAAARDQVRRRHARTVGEACSRPAVTVEPDLGARSRSPGAGSRRGPPDRRGG